MTDQAVWDRNKKFFGTSSQPEQIEKLLDLLKEQDKRIDKLEGKEPEKIEKRPVLNLLE